MSSNLSPWASWHRRALQSTLGALVFVIAALLAVGALGTAPTLVTGVLVAVSGVLLTIAFWALYSLLYPSSRISARNIRFLGYDGGR